MSYREVLYGEEAVILKLRSLYETFGYKKYSMSKFEEYDLYLENKSFLLSSNILAFHSPSGKLLALKPDITLSIVKNAKGKVGTAERVYYAENVYRASKDDHEIKEIMQVGLEYIGEVDTYISGEVISLAVKSLRSISENYIVSVSHMGFVTGLIDEYGVSFSLREKLLRLISDKNTHGIKALCEEHKIDSRLYERLEIACGICGDFESNLKKAEKIAVNSATKAALDELRGIFSVVKALGAEENVVLDLSVLNTIDYYNGVIFQGFIEGVPCNILSGGRYDKLVEKLGKSGGAIGFAVYIDLIERYCKSDREYDVDVLVVYGGEDVQELALKVAELTANGESVSVVKNDDGSLKYRKKVVVQEVEVNG